jgi:hypothetical protein
MRSYSINRWIPKLVPSACIFLSCTAIADVLLCAFFVWSLGKQLSDYKVINPLFNLGTSSEHSFSLAHEWYDHKGMNACMRGLITFDYLLISFTVDLLHSRNEPFDIRTPNPRISPFLISQAHSLSRSRDHHSSQGDLWWNLMTFCRLFLTFLKIRSTSIRSSFWLARFVGTSWTDMDLMLEKSRSWVFLWYLLRRWRTRRVGWRVSRRSLSFESRWSRDRMLVDIREK